MTAVPLVPTAFQPDISPVADSLAISALVALLPLITVFLTLGVLRWKAHWAGLTSVAVAIVVATVFFGMPLKLAAARRDPGRRRSASSRSCGSSSPRSGSTSSRCAQRPVRGPARDVPPHLRRPAHPGDHHRLLLRRPARGARRLRRPRRDHRRHAHGPGLLAAARRRRRAAGQHRPRRVRRDRHPDHHRRQPDRHPVPGDRRRTSVARPRSSRPFVPLLLRPHGRRPARRAPDLADRRRRRR